MLRVGTEETTLGRSADNTFPLQDMTVSRRHATMRMDARGLVTLSDEGSTNGDIRQRAPSRSRSLHDHRGG